MAKELSCLSTYRIRSNYRIYPYKRTLMKFRSLQITASVHFRSLQITASVHFIYFFIKAYVVGFWVPTTYAFIKKIRKNIA